MNYDILHPILNLLKKLRYNKNIILREASSMRAKIPGWKKNLYILWVCDFIMGMGFQLSMPFMSLYIKTLGHFDRFQLNMWSGLAFSATYLVSSFWRMGRSNRNQEDLNWRIDFCNPRLHSASLCYECLAVSGPAILSRNFRCRVIAASSILTCEVFTK